MAYTPNPTIISGGTGTGNILSNRRVVDISNEVAFYNPNANPFFLLAQKSSKKVAINPEFSCLEAQEQPVFDAINNSGGYSNSAVTLTVDHGSYFKANDVVLITRTGEIFKVSSVSGNNLTVVRGFGSVVASTIVNDDEIRRIGNVFEEGDSADTAKTVKLDLVTNYCQIFKTSVEITRTEMKSTLYGGADLPLRHKLSGIEHSRKIEEAFLFGQKKEYLTTSTTNATTSHPLRMTQGLLKFITSNTLSVGGGLTEATLNNQFLRYVFDADKNYRKKRTLFVSSLAGAAMNAWAGGKLQMVPTDKTYGITVNRYLSFFGEVNIVLHPLLTGSIYGGYTIAVDLENVGYRYIDDTYLETDIVKDGTDKRKDQFLTECGLEVKLEGVNGYAYGITG